MSDIIYSGDQQLSLVNSSVFLGGRYSLIMDSRHVLLLVIRIAWIVDIIVAEYSETDIGG
jgi:hypothetical protein